MFSTEAKYAATALSIITAFAAVCLMVIGLLMPDYTHCHQHSIAILQWFGLTK